MSGIAKAVGKVFKSVGSFVKKYWKPILAAVAIYFTAGAALAYFGAAGAAGGAAAVGAEGAAAGAAAEGGAAALGAGAADLGGAGVLTAEGAAAAGVGADAAGAGILGGTAAAEGGSVLAGTAGIGGGSVLGGTAGIGGATVGGDLLAGGTAAGAGAGAAQAGYGSAITNGANYLGAPGAPSSLWQTSLDIAGKAMKTPGVPSLIGGMLNSYQQSAMMNAQMKYQAERAPGNIAGGAGNAWQGFAQNKNLTPTTPMPSNSQLPPLTPYHLQPNQAQAPGMPGINQPGSNSANYPGYGTPGYGQQYPPGTAPPQPMPLAAMGQIPQDQYQQQGLLSQQTPFIESPYDESYA